MQIYHTIKDKQQQQLQQVNKKYNLLSICRFLSIALFFVGAYYYYKTSFWYFALLALICIVVFFVLLRLHQKLADTINLKKALIKINEQELSFLNDKENPFKNGAAFETHQHFYTYDLDIFGEAGLYQHLNRTATYVGAKKLADLLKVKKSNQQILLNQQAVKELASKLDWRQNLKATASIIEDKKEAYEKLIAWANTSSKLLPVLYLAVAWLLTFVIVFLIAVMIISGNPLYLNLSILMFIVNLAVVFSLNKRIRREINYFDGIDKITKQYGLIINHIENTNFESEKLQQLKSTLSKNNKKASVKIQKLSSLIASMDAVQNILIAILFNGFFLFHIHILYKLLMWKKQYAPEIENWLNVIGEFETLSSLANFSYNNPAYCFPSINNQMQIEMTDSGHPLIDSNTRVNNNATFNSHKFMVLTGSNMSGKSTFLRSLGVNMLLCNIGSCICAKAANIHPLDILVSMRLSDSLSENESYFFAEVKRLKQIMQQLDKGTAFVLLDEILRGTNSDDKRNGTIGVIKKLIEKKAIGGIATHDLEICNTTSAYPNYLSNNCFEVEIINNELVFDFKLRAGVCQNQSASFLMTKMEII